MPTLYIVGTPIGNLEDVTLRALRVLKEVQLVAAEDTRKAGLFLRHYDISVPLTSLFEANERRKMAEVLTVLAAGDVALISEAGMPGISDPGYPLVREAIERGFTVVPVPGPSAHTAALVVSGLPADRFMFLGFPPRKHPDRLFEKVAGASATLVLYEAPHRLRQTLEAMLEVLGDRQIALCRELTKKFEEVWRGSIAGALGRLEERPPRGEYTLVVAGASGEPERWAEAQVRAAFVARMSEGLSRSQAARNVAVASGWRRREIYALTTD